MFKNPFSFNGRIRRLEYGISFLLYFSLATLLDLTLDVENSLRDALTSLSFSIPGLWFLWAQGCKRCHDRDNIGWWQIIPFHFLWMLFGEGNRGPNEFGESPKIPVTPDWERPEDNGERQQPEVIPVNNVDGDGTIIENK